MKFIADENIEKPVINFLRSQGRDVIDIKEIKVGADDEEVLNIANQEGRILITNDKDFGELIFLQRRVSTGIILIRSSIDTAKAKIDLIQWILAEAGEKLKGTFAVVSERVYRLRPIRYETTPVLH